MRPVAFLGLGAMGLPMAARLAAAGLAVRGFDVRAPRRDELAAHGGDAASSPEEAARGAGTAIVMVLSAEQMFDAVLGDGGAAAALERDTSVVVASTVGPDAVRALADELAPRGIAVLDAPVSGGTARAESGELLILVGGPDALADTLEPMLRLMGSAVVRCGQQAGDGQAVKLVNQLLCGVHIAVAAEALAYAQALGLDAAAVHEAIRGGAAASFMLDNRGARMVRRQFTPPHSSLQIFVKDLGLVTDAAESAGFPTPIAAAAHQLFLMGAAEGLGDDDDAGVIRVLERWLPGGGPQGQATPPAP